MATNESMSIDEIIDSAPNKEEVDIIEYLGTGLQTVYVTAVDDEGLATSGDATTEYKLGDLKFVYVTVNNETYAYCAGADSNIGETIEIPAKVGNIPVKGIGDQAFQYKNIKKIILPHGLLYIGTRAFESSTIETIETRMTDGTIYVNPFPGTLKQIMSKAFYGCSYLKQQITLPDNLNVLGEAAFSYSGITALRTYDNSQLPSIPNSVCQSCPHLAAIRFGGDALMRIGMHAFNGCTNLQSVYLKASNLAWIGQSAFANCGALNKTDFDFPYGWFYTDVNASEPPNPVYNGVNCTYIDTITPTLISVTLRKHPLFRLLEMPAPAIKVADGVLTIVDTSGLADSFNVYISGVDEEKKFKTTVYAKKPIKAGTWRVRDLDNIVWPEDEVRFDVKFNTYGIMKNPETGNWMTTTQFTPVQIRIDKERIAYVSAAYDPDNPDPNVAAMGLVEIYTADTGFINDECQTIVVPNDSAYIPSNIYKVFAGVFERVSMSGADV